MTSYRESVDDVLFDTEEAAAAIAARQFRPLLRVPAHSAVAAAWPAVLTGELVAIADNGRTPLVLYEGRPGAAAVRARTTVELNAAHIGQLVVLVFEGGDAARPIVTGVIREREGWPLADPPGQVELDADGQRMVVSAAEQLVLRCGKASITLTRAGKVLIQGSYVSSRSTGVNRVRGGSVHLN